MKKYSLISVSDKTGLVELARGLVSAGYEIISTGGTGSALAKDGINFIPIEKVTGFPECMDGRLKTIHPKIAGGLLGVRDNPEHSKVMEEHAIPAIDILVVNLYPFEETPCIENIDIGGPSMVRAAAKNYKYVAVVTDPADYEEVVRRAKNSSSDFLDEDYRYELAAKAFRYTAAYDAYIAQYLSKEMFPDKLTLTFSKHSDMRYGENPHQNAAYYTISNSAGLGYPGIESAKVLHGKPLSYNNIADAHAAVALMREFTEPVCVAVKHSTPCGVALGKNAHEAYVATYECDPQSIFGGIVAFNREVDELCAHEMNEIFLEVIIAPTFSSEALSVLTAKKNLRLLELSQEVDKVNSMRNSPGRAAVDISLQELEFKSVGAGLLIQESDSNDMQNEESKVVTQKAPSPEILADLTFAMKIVKHVKSNAIVVAKDGRLLGQGGGEVSRVWAAQAALSRAAELVKILDGSTLGGSVLNGSVLDGAVLASDALIPFPDVIEAAGQAGISAIIQPGGSRNDQIVIDACNEHGIAMVLTGIRHFKH